MNSVRRVSARSFCSVLKKKRPNGFWKDVNNQRLFMNEAMKKLELKELDDWYSISANRLTKIGGSSLLRQYPTFMDLLSSVYPEHSWNPFKRSQVPHNYWKDVNHQRKWIHDLSNHLNITEINQWNQVSAKDVTNFPGGYRMLTIHGGVISMISHFYPDFKIDSSQRNMPSAHWKSYENQRIFMDNLGNQLGIKDLSEWRNVSYKKFLKHGGGSILLYYNSFFDLLQAIYPEYNWKNDLYKTGRVPLGYWHDIDNIRHFIKYFENVHFIKKLEDWYRISWIQIRKAGGGGLVPKYRKLSLLLRDVYPNFPWDDSKLSLSHKQSCQNHIFKIVVDLFPQEDVIEEYLYETESRSFEFDIYVPCLKLAFEYQGEHHYKEIPAFAGLELYIERDRNKRNFAKENDITLIEIPFDKWDGTKELLISYIKANNIEIFNKIKDNEQKF